MQLWLVLLGCGAVLGLIAVFAALRVELDARGFGEPSGGWAFAFGLGVRLAAVSGVCGKGVPLAAELHVLGRRFPLRWRGRKRREKPPEEAAKAPPRERLGVRIERWLGSPSSIEHLLRVRRRFRLDGLVVDTSYGFSDIALTGRVAGALYALSGALPESVTLNQRPRWDGSERWELSLSGRVALYPVLVLFDLLWYMLRTRFGRSFTKSVGAPPAQPPLENPS